MASMPDSRAIHGPRRATEADVDVDVDEHVDDREPEPATPEAVARCVEAPAVAAAANAIPGKRLTS